MRSQDEVVSALKKLIEARRELRDGVFEDDLVRVCALTMITTLAWVLGDRYPLDDPRNPIRFHLERKEHHDENTASL